MDTIFFPSDWFYELEQMTPEEWFGENDNIFVEVVKLFWNSLKCLCAHPQNEIFKSIIDFVEFCDNSTTWLVRQLKILFDKLT
jgi:hypothetical protein